MRRGDVVVVAARGAYTSKPRPAVVMQDDMFNDELSSIVVCPLTTQLSGAKLLRVRVAPDEHNLLQRESEAMPDKIAAVPSARLRPTGGRVDAATTAAIARSLRHLLRL